LPPGRRHLPLPSLFQAIQPLAFALLGRAFALIRLLLAEVSGLFALIGQAVTFVRTAVAHVRHRLPQTGRRFPLRHAASPRCRTNARWASALPLQVRPRGPGSDCAYAERSLRPGGRQVCFNTKALT